MHFSTILPSDFQSFNGDNILSHAGYSYSGPCAAHAYKHLDTEGIKTVFVLGPSHHYYLDSCALSQAQAYQTPLGCLQICQDTYNELKGTGEFELMRMSDDEAEHSIEMHMPYIAQRFNVKNVKIVPILVGALDFASEEHYGKLLAPYLSNDKNVFILSSDFCHWGRRFQFTPFCNTCTSSNPLYKCIQTLDSEGMKLITEKDPVAFYRYLQQSGNTICGRHPITVALFMMKYLTSASDKSNRPNKKQEHEILFTKYEQSSAAKSINDSSVSYASAIFMEDES